MSSMPQHHTPPQHYTPPPQHYTLQNQHKVHHHNQMAAQHMDHSPFDTLAPTSSQYAALQFHQNHHLLPDGKEIFKPHHMLYSNGPLAATPRSQHDLVLHERLGRRSIASCLVRRRISRACDQCNQLRTKCDGSKYQTAISIRVLTCFL